MADTAVLETTDPLRVLLDAAPPLNDEQRDKIRALILQGRALKAGAR